MKQTRKMLNWLVAGGVALAMVTCLTAQTVQQRTGVVVRLKGHARYTASNNQWQEIKIGTKIKSGYLVQTAAGSYMDIVVGGTANVPSRAVAVTSMSYQPNVKQDVVRVWEDSVLVFDKLTEMKTGADEVTETQLDLHAGKISGSVNKLSAASRYEIKIPNGIAGIRGTTYTISAAGVIEVQSGAVVVSWTEDGKPMTQVVNAGWRFDLRDHSLNPLPPESRVAIPGVSYMTAQERTIDQTTYYVSPKGPSSN
jgi:FecR protein